MYSNTLILYFIFLYLLGEWLWRFDSEFTTSEPFYINEYQIIDVDMMLGPKYPLSVFTYNELDAQVTFSFFTFGQYLLVILLFLMGTVPL